MTATTTKRNPQTATHEAKAVEHTAEIVWLGCEYVPRGARKRTLVTGDILAEHRGVQTVILGEQGILTLFADGSAHLQSPLPVHATHKDGVSTLIFSECNYLRFDCYGLVCIVRGDKIVALRPPLVPPRRTKTMQGWLPVPGKATVGF